MSALRLGSMCSGYGGLELGVGRVLPVEVVWHCEVDAAASKVLAHRWPGVPNLGDLRAVDWAGVEPVDVLCAGFPCQPVSQAGQRAGVDDERWLFDDIADAVGRMGARPRLLVFENVAGLLSANGGAAMGRVVHGLAGLGYVGSWRAVRAADVGAPHRRERVFIVASDTGSAGTGRDGRAVPGPAGGARRPRVDVHAAVDAGAAAADARGSVGRPAGLSESGDSPATHGGRGTAKPRGCGRPPAATDWGQYEPAIRRWEHLTRSAPAPKDEKGRLSPVFVEWMMGLPAGWVTDVPGIARTAQLHILGNGVVPQQAAAAVAGLLDVEGVPA